MNKFFRSARVCALLAWLCCQGGTVTRADIVVSTFEEPGLAANFNSNLSYEGQNEAASQFRSGAVTFDNDGVFFGGSTWSGFGYSRRTVPGLGQNLYDSSNDLIARPGIGADGSATWAVVGSGGVMTADAGYHFQSMSLTNTLYTWDSMANGDPFAGPAFSDAGGTGRFTGLDDFFTVRFTNTSTTAFLDFNLADYRPPAQPGDPTDYVYANWELFDVSILAASQLSISFLGSRESNFIPPPDPPQWFLDTPAYAALDNVTVASIVAVPEPTSLMLVGGAMIVAIRRRLARRAL